MKFQEWANEMVKIVMGSMFVCFIFSGDWIISLFYLFIFMVCCLEDKK